MTTRWRQKSISKMTVTGGIEETIRQQINPWLDGPRPLSGEDLFKQPDRPAPFKMQFKGNDNGK